MKRILQIFLLTLSLLLLLSAIACNKPEPTPDGEGQDQVQETIDRTKPSAGKYKIRFFLAASYVTHYYNEGETIVPPETLPTYETPQCSYVFDGWDGVEFKTVTGDATYRAKYKEVYKTCTVTFVVGNSKKEVEIYCGDYPKAPAITEFELEEGVQFVMWDRAITASTEDTTYYGIVTKYFTPTLFTTALNTETLTYSNKVTDNDNKNGTTGSALALNILLIEEKLNPQGGAVVNRIVEHFVESVKADQAPEFDASCNWSYAPHTASIALAKTIPTVWNAIPYDIKLRLDTTMRAYAILGSLITSDYNNYSTGPGMQGNYGKNWNPNYRLANIPIMVYTTYYFGNGDMDVGAEYVNDFLKGFNESAYTDMVNTFQKYGWRRASLNWTADARKSSDGKTQGVDAKTMMLKGGQVVGEDTPTDSPLLVALGNGVGVTNGGKDYLYKGFALNEPDGIIRSLLLNNYGYEQDYTKANSTVKSTFQEVKSGHWYDKDGDGQKELIAWILGENNTSPYEGQYGMMREFASGNRSSTGYCSHDFLLTTSLIYSTKLLGIYDLATDTFTDKYGIDIREAIVVGNEDFLFKNEQGYQGYATGSYGENAKSHSEKNEGNIYFALKHLWRNFMKIELETAITE